MLCAIPPAPAPAAAPPQSTAAPDLLAADLSQGGRKLTFTVSTRAAVPLSRLDRLPPTRTARSRYLCLSLRRVDRRGERRLCLGGRGARRQIGLLLVNDTGRTTEKRTIPARLQRPGDRRLVMSLVPEDAGLRPDRYRWRVLENQRGCRACEESLPRDAFRVFRLRPVRPVGCTGRADLVYNGPRDRKAVALTFDDGPSVYTDDFLAVLRRKRAHATFFPIGQEVGGRQRVLRHLLRDGSEIGIHTMHHDPFPSYSDLSAASALIRRATHFQPCLFRPPGGAISSSVIQMAGQLGMRTILWDVDPMDWSSPGSGAVYSRVVGAVRPGSIVVMHDGGGARGGTLAALPSIIDTLRARGYRFKTVSELLGNRIVYRPYG